MRCKPSFFSAIATSITVLAIAPPMLAHPALSITQAQTWKTSQLPQTASLIYVAPRANPNGNGSPNNPYPSIAAALATKPVAGTVIQLQEGLYSADTGESFPIKLPAGVTLRGAPTVRGLNTVIRGGGKFISTSFASQNITMLADNDARIEGVTVTNPNTRGTAVWVESGKRVAIANNTFINSDREGLFLTGTADAIVSDNVFKRNGANGLSAVGSSTGEIRNNTFESTGFGLAIGQNSRVNVSNNNILNNTDGIIVSNLSAPTLRNNLISDNKRDGIVILKDRKGYPTPDLGTSTSLGKNTFRNNLGKDINNNSGVTQVAVGNQLDPKKIAGNIAFVGESPTAPAPQIPSTPLPAATATLAPARNTANPSNIDTVEITRPQTSFIPPATSPTALAPSNNSILIEPLPDVPQPVTPAKPSSSLISPTTAPVIASKPTTPSANLAQSPNEVLIDRDPIPVVPPRQVTPPQSIFVPSNPPATTNPPPATTNPPPATTNPPPTTSIPPKVTPPPTQTAPIPYNPQIAALVPPPARDTTPYLVVIPSSDAEALSRVRSVVPSGKVIPSRFGNIILVQGYPDRDRAEVLKVIMRSAIGLDARVIHQNSL
jgi:parallel beta-helix repeat protein